MGLFGSKRKIVKVKLIGVWGYEQQKMMSAKQSGMYSLIVFYSDNTKKIVECDLKEFEERYLEYLDIAF